MGVEASTAFNNLYAAGLVSDCALVMGQYSRLNAFALTESSASAVIRLAIDLHDSVQVLVVFARDLAPLVRR